MRYKKSVLILALIIIFLAAYMVFKIEKRSDNQNQIASEETGIVYYTCGMHPSVKVSPEEYENGQVNCPICNMRLVPVYKKSVQDVSYYGCGMKGSDHVFQMEDAEGTLCPICGMKLKKLSRKEAEDLKGVVAKVTIKERQALLAGVETERVEKHHLFKEIRAVGRVAYDPQLAIAQEEFISALKALDRISKGNIPEIEERSKNLVESSKRRLRLLGLSQQQIEKLEETREVQTSLILPEKKMWIYGDIYEYELSWLKVGEKVKVTTPSLPGEEFKGLIESINPVLDPKTRSVRFRAQVDNIDLRLKPEMYVDIIIESMYTNSDGEHMVLAIPKAAVLDTGLRKIVWVDKGSGDYEGIEVQIGPEATTVINEKSYKFYPVIRGLREGDMAVTKANFLIDSQSQISGVAATAYGGSLKDEGSKAGSAHQH